MFAFDFDGLEGNSPAGELPAETSSQEVPTEDYGAEVQPPAENIAGEEPLAGSRSEEESGSGAELTAKSSAEQFLGSWMYMGRHGRTVYKIRAAWSGHLIFQGPNATGEKLSGILQLQVGGYLQARLVDETAKEVGMIRVSPSEDGRGVVSSFQPSGKEEWGREILARRVTVVGDSAGKGQALEWEDNEFTVHRGFLRVGDDIRKEETTLAQAKARSRQMLNCAGFCFKGEPHADGALTVYYKSRWDLVRAPLNGGEWTSYRAEGNALNLSDLPGAGVDEAIIAEVVASRFDSVYVFKSPLAPFPEWKKQLKVHQIVILWHSDNAGLQLEYFVGGVHFQRKPYPWLHRGGAELVEHVVPENQPEGGFSGERVAEVMRKWLLHGTDPNSEAADKDCVLFAMEVVGAIAGAMSMRLRAHFGHVLGQQFGAR